MCQRIKNYIEVPVGKLIANKVPERPYTHLMVDFITKLPLVAEKNIILIKYNRLLKITYFVTITKEISREKLARLFKNNIWKL